MAIGEDVVNASTENMHKILLILLEIIKAMENAKRNRADYIPDSKTDKAFSKIKFGEMKFSDYKKLLESGERMMTVSVPAEKLQVINEYSKKVGAAYFTLETGDKTANVVVPERYQTQFNDALRLALEEQLSADRSSLAVKDGAKLTSEEDIELVRTVLDYHDIPVYSFRNSDGGYMNIVPSEYDGQYENALKEVQTLKEEMKSIDIEVFEQSLPFAYLENTGERVIDVTGEQAEFLAENLPEKSVHFMKDENGSLSVRFGKNSEESVTQCLNDLSESVKQAEEYSITVVDSHITVNKEKLVESENENEYFTRVPNTGGKDYIRIDKSEAELIDGGKTISAKLDFEKTYRIFDKEGNLKSECTGRELAASYNTKSRNANKDTSISHYHNDSLERVELYNAKENKLISIGIESAETFRRDLAEQGITGRAAEKLLADIDKSLPSEYKGKFDYAPRKKEVDFEEVKSGDLRQFKINEKLKNCEMSEGNRETVGSKCCVLDRNTNKYILVPAKENRLREALEKMGYDKLHINAVMSEVVKFFDKSGAQLERESVQIQSFDTNNAEIAGQFQYSADNNGVTVIQTDIKGDEAAFKYLEISADSGRSEIEQAIKKGFDIKDAASVAEMMKCMSDKGLISPAPSAVTKDGFEVAKITSDFVSISRSGQQLTVNRDNIDIGKICEKFGIDERSAERLKNSLDRSLKAAEKKPGMGQTLAEIKAAAKRGMEKINAEKEKNKTAEKALPKTNTER